jgi:hypothetical protein
MYNGTYVNIKQTGAHEKEYQALALVLVHSNENPFEIRAGAEGMKAIVFDFPSPTTYASIGHAHQARETRTVHIHRSRRENLCRMNT